MSRSLTPILIGLVFLVTSANAGSVPLAGTWDGTLQNTALFEKFGANAETPYTYTGWNDVFQGQLTLTGDNPLGIGLSLTDRPHDPVPVSTLTGRFGTPVETAAGVDWDIFFFRPGQSTDVGVLHFVGTVVPGTGSTPDELTGAWTHQFLISDTNTVGLAAVFDVSDGTFNLIRSAGTLVPLPPAAWAGLIVLLPMFGTAWRRRRR